MSDHAAEIERFAGQDVLDYVLYNQQAPTEDVAQRYEEEGGYISLADMDKLSQARYQAVGGNFLGKMAAPNDSDTLIGKRSLIRHDAKAVAKLILELYQRDED